MFFRQLFDRDSSTFTYLIADEETQEAALVDPVRDQIDRDLSLIEELGFTLKYTFETHVHADHIAASGMLRKRVGSESVMGAHAGAACADHMLGHADRFQLGSVEVEARHTPGHTSGCVSFVIPEERLVFTGDTLLVRGCGRTDFQEGDAGTLYDSVHQQLYSLPDHFAVYPGHDYRGRSATSIGEEKRHNPRLKSEVSRDAFIEIMGNLNLSQPRMIAVAVPANLMCGLDPETTPWAVVTHSVDGVPEVDVAWLRSHRAEALLIDVREEEEIVGELKILSDAEHVPLGMLGDVMRNADRDAPVVIICRSGRRSARAVVELGAAGFSRCASLAGGMIAWYESQPGSCG